MEEFIETLTSRNTYIGFIASFILALLGTKADSLNFWKSLCHKRIFSAIILFSIVLWCILTFDYSFWWLLISLIPLYYQFILLPHEWLLIRNMKQKRSFCPQSKRFIFTIKGQMLYSKFQILFTHDAKTQQELKFTHLNSLELDTLFPHEIRNFYLPALHVLITIGDYSRLRQELSKLSAYNNHYLYIHYQVCLAFNAADYNHMLVWLDKSEKVKRDEEKELIDIINRVCAYANLQDKLNLQKWLKILEQKIQKGTFNIKAIENLILFYEQTQDISQIEHLISIIHNYPYKDFHTYTTCMDVIYNYNKRQNNIAANKKLIEEVSKKAEILITDEEERLRTKIRMLRLKFECNDGWEEYSNNLFKDAKLYLEYSHNVAIDFMEVTKIVLMDAHIVYNLRLPENVLNNLTCLISDYVLPHMQKTEEEFANLDDAFVYRKKELLMQMRTFLFYNKDIEKHIVDHCNQSLEIFKQIINLCNRSENYREALHFKVCLVDEILSYRDQVLQIGDKIQTTEYKKQLAYYEKEARDAISQIEDVIRNDGYSISQAYYILYLSQFYHQLNMPEDARFYFHKFIATKTDARNFSLAIQKMFGYLKNTYAS